MDAYSEVPDTLKNTPNWVTWKMEMNGDHPTKIPNGSSTDPATWSTFDDVIKREPRKGGIGFVFNGKGLTGIDLDKCIDKNGNITKFSEVLSKLKSYTEISPSGTGLHLLIKCNEIPYKTGRKKNGVEIYSTGRFFTVTGNRLEGVPSEICEYPAELVREVLSPFLGKEAKVKPFIQSTTAPQLSDSDILSVFSHARNYHNFQRLMNGDINGYPESQTEKGYSSEADLALAGMIAFYTDDQAQIERIMRGGKLSRKKWDREDYLPRTIDRALSQRTTRWQPKDTGLPSKKLIDIPADQSETRIENDPIFVIGVPIEDNLISKWCKYATSVMDSYPEYHLAAMLILFSHLFDAYMNPQSGKVNNNLWCIILGRSSVSGKTTACNAVINGITKDTAVINYYHSLAQKITPEAFIKAFCSDEKMVTPKGFNRRLHYLSEASGFLKFMKRDNGSELNELIIDAYDGSKIGKETVGYGLITEWDPRYSGLWTTVPEVFGGEVSPERFRSGAFIRPFYIMPNRPKETKEDMPIDPETEELKNEVVENIGKLLKVIHGRTVEFQESSKIAEWKKARRNELSDNELYSNIEQSVYYRIFDITRKVAMNLTLASKEFLYYAEKYTPITELEVNGEIVKLKPQNNLIFYSIPDEYAEIAIRWAETVFFSYAMAAQKLTWGQGNHAKVMTALQGGKDLKRTEIGDMVKMSGQRLTEFLAELPVIHEDRPCPPSRRFVRFYRLE